MPVVVRLATYRYRIESFYRTFQPPAVPPLQTLGLGQLSHRDPKVSSCPLYIAHAPVTSITAPCQLTPPVSILLCATFRVAQHLKASVRRRTGEQSFCHMTYYYIVPGPGPTALDAVYFLRAISHRRDAGSGSF
jgi:hypothetical protein